MTDTMEWLVGIAVAGVVTPSMAFMARLHNRQGALDTRVALIEQTHETILQTLSSQESLQQESRDAQNRMEGKLDVLLSRS